MDNSSKKIVLIISAAALVIMAVMAFNTSNQPAAQTPPIADAPEAGQASTVTAAKPEQAQAPDPVNAAPTTGDIQAINGEPSMILEGSDINIGGESNRDEPATTDNVQ